MKEFEKIILAEMKTPEMTTVGRIMDAISSYLPRSVSTPMWNSMSRTFAKGAAGGAHFFTITAGPRPGSIWLNVEKPILEKFCSNNKSLTTI